MQENRQPAGRAGELTTAKEQVVLPQDINSPLAEETSLWRGLEKLGPQRSVEILWAISARFSIDPKSPWWWDKEFSGRATASTTDDLDILRTRFPHSEPILFVPTDDEFAPWTVYQSKLPTVISFLCNSPFFEYFIATIDYAKIAFDNHHNQLIFVDAELRK
jgi:hypothetical protein